MSCWRPQGEDTTSVPSCPSGLQPLLVRRGRREDLHRRRGKAVAVGHGDGGLFSFRLGAEYVCKRPTSARPAFDQWGIVGGHTSAYRWHVQDPLVFQSSIKVTLEHWGWISTDENPEAKSHSWNDARMTTPAWRSGTRAASRAPPRRCRRAGERNAPQLGSRRFRHSVCR